MTRPLPPNWRPLPGKKEPPPPKRVSESIERVARRLGAPPPSALNVVFAKWPETVGAQVAAHSTPISLVKGRLTVSVDQPGWATQLRYLAPQVLERLAEAAGEGVVTELSIRVGTR